MKSPSLFDEKRVGHQVSELLNLIVFTIKWYSFSALYLEGGLYRRTKLFLFFFFLFFSGGKLFWQKHFHFIGGLSRSDGEFASEASWICFQDALQTFSSKVYQRQLILEISTLLYIPLISNRYPFGAELPLKSIIVSTHGDLDHLLHQPRMMVNFSAFCRTGIKTMNFL